MACGGVPILIVPSGRSRLLSAKNFDTAPHEENLTVKLINSTGNDICQRNGASVCSLRVSRLLARFGAFDIGLPFGAHGVVVVPLVET